MNTIRCKLITPSDCILDDEITEAVIPAWDGLFGVLPGRAAIVAKLGLGELTLDFPDQKGGRGARRSYLIEDGFVQVIDNRLTILARRAIPAEELSETDAKAELAEAYARTVPESAPDRVRQLEQVTLDRRRAQLKLDMAARSRKTGI
ncbi:MAG: F0F1 ATP synthase subunit epsilon [Planctomycetes bacterium]|nr:F0F1 ATP synthase subunit epsilon [Planctomycetota bacterium]